MYYTLHTHIHKSYAYVFLRVCVCVSGLCVRWADCRPTLMVVVVVVARSVYCATTMPTATVYVLEMNAMFVCSLERRMARPMGFADVLSCSDILLVATSDRQLCNSLTLILGVFTYIIYL